MGLPYRTLRSLYRSLPHSLGNVLRPVKDSYLHRRHEEEVRQLVSSVASQIADAASPYARKILVDCGFNTGLVMENMIGSLKGFEFYGFEVNRDYFGDAAKRLQVRHPNILAMNFQAVSDHDGQAQFHIVGARSGPYIAEATTILPPGQMGDIPDSEPSHSVDAIDFSRWLRETFVKHSNGQPPYVAVKMDIEGAEYDVLEKMVKDGTINYVNDLIVEFHSRRFDEAVKPSILRREHDLRQQISAAHVRLHEWD